MADPAKDLVVRDGKAFIKDASGNVFAVSPEAAHAKISGGHRFAATPEEIGAAEMRTRRENEQLKTAGESLVAGAIDAVQLPVTFPVRLAGAAYGAETDPIAPISGRQTIENAMAVFGGEQRAQEYATAARERAIVNPGSATAGRIGGEVLGGLGVSGGLKSAAGAGAKALGGGLAARLGAGAAAGAIEGAGYGATQASEDAYIANTPLTAEKMVAAMGWGAIVGGAVGLGAEGIGAFTRRGSRGATPFDSPRLRDAGSPYREAAGIAEDAAQTAAQPNRLQQWLSDFADERTVKALGARGSDIKKLGRTAGAAEKQMRQMARDVLEHKLDDGTNVFRAGASPEDLAETLGRAEQELGSKLGKMREMADDVIARRPELAPRPRDIANRVRREVIAPLQDSPLAAIRSQAAPLEQLAQDIEDTVGSTLIAQPGSRGRLVGTGDRTSVARLTELRQGLDTQIYQAKRGVNLVQQGAAPDVKALERARWIVEESIEAAVDKASQHFDDAAASAYKTTKVKYRSMKLAGDIAGAAQAQNLGNRVLSPSDYLTGMAAAAGDLAGGGGAFSAVKGLAVGAAHKAIRENASSVLAVLADRLARNVDTKLDHGISGFFSASLRSAEKPLALAGKVAQQAPATVTTAARAARTPTAIELFQGREPNIQAAYQKRVEQIIRSTANYGEGVRNATQTALGGLSTFAPKLAQAAVVTTTKGAEYLKLHVPAGLIDPTVYQPSRRSQVSDLDIAAFARRWAAVANPMSVINDLRRGTVTHEQIDALKNVYPALYQELQVKVLERLRDLDAKGARVPFEARLQLDLLLDLNGAGDPALEPGFISRLTGLLQQKQAQQAQQKPPARPINLAKSRQSGADEALLGGTQ